MSRIYTLKQRIFVVKYQKATRFLSDNGDTSFHVTIRESTYNTAAPLYNSICIAGCSDCTEYMWWDAHIVYIERPLKSPHVIR